MPSKWYEGFPNVIVRAMLLKRPVITTNIGAMQSIIDNGINGLLIPPADSLALTKAVNDLWNNTDLCTYMGIKGREKADALYSREEIYNTLMDIYNRAKENRDTIG